MHNVSKAILNHLYDDGVSLTFNMDLVKYCVYIYIHIYIYIFICLFIYLIPYSHMCIYICIPYISSQYRPRSAEFGEFDHLSGAENTLETHG